MATTNEPDQPVARATDLEHRWLDRLLLGGALTSAGMAVGGAVVAVALDLRHGPELATLAMAVGLAPVLLVARLAVRRGYPAVAATIVAALLLGIAMVIAFVIPAAVAQPSILAVLGFVVARQYVRGRALAALAVVCWLVSVAAVTTMLARSGLGDSWVDYAFGVVPISATLAGLFAALTLFAERTARALEDQRAAVAAMASAGIELEASRRVAEQVTEAVPGIVLVYETATGAMSYGNGAARAFVDDSSMPGDVTLAGIVERGVHPAEQPSMEAWRLELGSAVDDEIRTTSARLLKPEGWSWFDIRGKVFRRSSDGTPTHVLALGQDATIERTATLQRDRFFDLSGDAFVVVGTDARIVHASPSLAPMLGVDPGRLVGLDMRRTGHPDEREEVEDLMARLAHGEPRVSRVLRERNAAGEWRAIEWTLAIDPEDLLMYGAARDITDRLATRDALERARHLETIGRLAGGVAHDVNNSLTAIGGFASLIEDATVDVDVRELAGLIRVSVDRTAMMTRKLLAFSRRQAQAPRVVDLGEVLHDLRPMVAQLMTEAITVDLVTGPAPRVLIDPAGVEQIVLNLAVNARDAMPSGGTLTIACGAAVLGDEEPSSGLAAGRYAEIVVRDTGSGMSHAVRSRIFEPFFSTKGDSGTGLGLAIVHGLVTGAGGGIEVDSTPGRGTTFRILLPEAVGEVHAGLSPDAVRSATPSRHVLVVEDEPTIRRLAQTILERAGHRVTVAQDGDHALDALDHLPPGDRFDLLVTDIVMPGMSGVDLAHRIRERDPLIPIIFASGYDKGLLPSEGPFAEARLLEKPYSPAVLAAAVTEATR